MTDDTLHPAASNGDITPEGAPRNERLAAEQSSAAAPQYGVGPFSIREVAIVAVWFVAFVVSFFPLYPAGSGTSVWGSGIDWVLQIGVPSVAVFLLILRRFSPTGIPRVGSLGVDQFASVAFSVAAVVWGALLWRALTASIATGASYVSWVVWVEAILFLGLVVLTVAAPWIPTLSDDFRERVETPAHRAARPARAVVARPHAPRPAPHEAPAAYGEPATAAFAPATTPASESYAAEPYAAESYASDPATPHATDPYADGNATDFGVTDAYRFGDASLAASHQGVADASLFPGGIAATDAPSAQPADSADAPHYARRTSFADDIDETVVSVAAAPAPQAAPEDQPFWALVPVERAVVDEATGAHLFTVAPTAWALVLADRGDTFVVRHEDGRTGILTDVSGVTRG